MVVPKIDFFKNRFGILVLYVEFSMVYSYSKIMLKSVNIVTPIFEPISGKKNP